MSASFSPASFKALGMAYTGPTPISSGSVPAVAKATKRARGLAPSARARSIDITTAAAAPSLLWEAFPAVTVPRAWNTGLSFASASSDVSRRGPSSVSKTILRVCGLSFPFRLTSTTSRETTSSLNLHPAIAASARWWLRSENSSACSRVIWCLRSCSKFAMRVRRCPTTSSAVGSTRPTPWPVSAEIVTTGAWGRTGTRCAAASPSRTHGACPARPGRSC